MTKPDDTHIPPELDFDIFVKVSGKRPDQTAGFRRWISSRKVGKQTLQGWLELWRQFLESPVK